MIFSKRLDFTKEEVKQLNIDGGDEPCMFILLPKHKDGYNRVEVRYLTLYVMVLKKGLRKLHGTNEEVPHIELGLGPQGMVCQGMMIPAERNYPLTVMGECITQYRIQYLETTIEKNHKQLINYYLAMLSFLVGNWLNAQGLINKRTALGQVQLMLKTLTVTFTRHREVFGAKAMDEYQEMIPNIKELLHDCKELTIEMSELIKSTGLTK